MSGGGRIVAAWWSIVAVLAAFVCAFPWIAGVVATNDDLKFVRAEALGRGAWSAIEEAWRTSSTFRPLDLLLGSWCDPVTLSVGPAPVVQALGLGALLLATALLARRAAPWFPSAGPIAAILVLLSPATTSSLWQVDAASQTWSAALGVLAMVLALDAWRSPGAPRLVALGCIFLVGCTIKESFYGWSAAIGGAVVLGLVRSRRDGAGALRVRASLLLPVVAVPAAHLALRIATGALGSAAQSDPGARYKAELGINLLVNAGMAVAGSMGNGPFHAVTDEAAPAAVRALPLLSALAALGALAAAMALAAFHRSSGGFGRLAPALAAGAVGIACLVVYLPMGAVSELYCLGSNAPVAVALAVALCALWAPQADDERAIGRTAALGAGLVLAGVGAFGLVGRAMHHRLTWQYADLANRAILDHVARVPSVDPASGRAAWVLFLPAPCILGRTYGQYVIPPAQAIGIDETLPWLARRDPSRPGTFTVNPAPGALPASDLVLDCASFPPRPHW